MFEKWYFLKNLKQPADKCKQIFENLRGLPPLKRILALPIQGQICTVSELEHFTFVVNNYQPLEICMNLSTKSTGTTFLSLKSSKFDDSLDLEHCTCLQAAEH